MIKKNVLKVGCGFLVALAINYFFYSFGFLAQTIVCSLTVLVLYEAIDRFTGRLEKWDNEYNEIMNISKQYIKPVKFKSEGSRIMTYKNKFGKDISRLMENIKNDS